MTMMLPIDARTPHLALLKIFDGSRQGAGPQDVRQVLRRFLAEVTFDDAVVLDPAVDDRSGVNLIVEHDGHGMADVGFGEGSESRSRGIREMKSHVVLPGISVS